jgi:hypothetical protein
VLLNVPLAKGLFCKIAPWTPKKLLLIKSFGRFRNLFSKRFLAAGGIV